MLRAAEKKILSCKSYTIPVSPANYSLTHKIYTLFATIADLKTAHRGFYVDIGPTVGDADKVWTISMNTESERTPLVLIHGMGAGVAFWVLNLDAFAEHRPVYAMDILGFGRSSRPVFSTDPLEAENQLVLSIEEWRREMNIPKMILLGHSLGGFLSTSYTMQYPDR